MKKFITILFLIGTAKAQQLDFRIGLGINDNQTFTTNAGLSFSYHNSMIEGNLICAGYSGERQPVLFGGRVGYQVWYLTPMVGYYYAKVSDDKKSLNYSTMLYGIRAEKEIVNGNGLYLEYDFARQHIFLIGAKIKL